MSLVSTVSATKRMLSLSEGMDYTGLGRNGFLQFARECGAVKRYGRRCLYDVRILDKALDELPGYQDQVRE